MNTLVCRCKTLRVVCESVVCSRLEGQLSKWTNALKGWQPRWLSVDQQQGVLHYYTVSRERTRLWRERFGSLSPSRRKGRKLRHEARSISGELSLPLATRTLRPSPSMVPMERSEFTTNCSPPTCDVWCAGLQVEGSRCQGTPVLGLEAQE